MIDVLLIYPPYSYSRKNPPLGLAYIASVLEKAGYSVKILDMSPIGIDWIDLEKEVCRNRPKMVGISFMTNQFRDAIMASKVIKKVSTEIPIVVGGPHASALPEEMIGEDSIDFVAIGEGENTVLQLANELFRGSNDFKKVTGIAFKQDGKVFVTEKREYIEDLDTIPFPAWHLLPIERYSVHAAGANVGERMLTILSSRGCPYQCVFCDSHTIFGRRFRSRSAKNIFGEIMYLKDRYGVKQFDFVDDTITVDKKRMFALCNLILEKNLKIIWVCNARVNTINLEMLELMKKAGCVRIDVGVESGDENVLSLSKKGITQEQIRNAHNIALKTGIKVNTFLMVGNIGEDFSSVKRTVELMKNYDVDANVAIATPFPGTELYRVARANNWLRVFDWSKYVTAPTALPGYRPVMVTDKMNQDEIMEAFFYVHSRLVRRKLQMRYGKWFFLNPRFYLSDLLRVRSWRELKHKAKMAKELLVSLLKYSK